MKKILSNFIVLFTPWIMLSGMNVTDLLLGVVVTLILSWVIKEYLDFSFGINFPAQVFKFVFIYIPYFLIQLVKANIDVMLIVLDPSLPIAPGFVKLDTELKNDYAKLILANSITLTPGTLSIDVDEENVFIHWINLTGNTKEEEKENVFGKFEEILGGIFNWLIQV